MTTLPISTQRRLAVLNNPRYSQYLRLKQDEFKQRRQLENVRQKDNSDRLSTAGFFEKAGETIGDLFSNVVSGVSKGLEGIYDFGASIVGGVGGIFDKDFQNTVKEHVSYDWTGNNITTPLQNYFDDSYLNDSKLGNFVENVASGVGQMLPAVIVTAATGGAGAGAFITPGMATMGASAMGNATESAFNDGAGYGQGMAYGIGSGLVEVATEKIGGKLFGNSPIDDALGLKPANKTLFKTAKTGFGKAVQGAIGEGIEEGMAELVNPLTKTIYKGTDALNEYKDKEFWGRVGESAIVGAGTSIAYGGTLGRIHKNTNNANETLAELKTLDMKEENLHASNELFEGNNQQKIDNLRAELRAELSKDVSKMSEKTRVKYIAQNNLSNILNEDGSLKTITTNSAQSTQAISKGGQNGLASDIDNRYYSVGLRGQEQNIVNGLKSQGVKVFNGQLTATEQDNYNRFKKTHLALSRKGLVRSNFVISEQSSKFDAYLDGNTTVFGKQVFESEEWQKKLIHEIEHFTEGSKEWYEFADFVMNETNLDEANKDILSKKYGITQEDIVTLSENLKNNKVTDKQKRYISEVIATQSEFLFGNEQSIERLTATKRNIAQKIYDKIKEFIEVLKAKTPNEKQFIQKLQKAENLFKKALDKAGTDYLTRQSIDTNGKLIYNNTKFARKTVKYISYDKIGYENISNIRSALSEIYKGLDNCVADNIAVESGKNVFIVDSGKENGSISFGIRKKLEFSNSDFRKEYVRRKNNESISKGYISNGLSSRFRNQYDNNRRGSTRQESGKELSVNSRESEYNKGRVSSQNGDRRGRIKQTKFGDGYSADNIDIKEYHLVNFKNDTRLKMFERQVSLLEENIKDGYRISFNLKTQLFDVLQQQENNVYSKLPEIDEAIKQTQEKFEKNPKINVIQEFISNLGYNGVFVKENTRTQLESVIYDINKKKENLLDYSKDRAKARLDKAIELFGEAKNPASAGWLLSDGRFVEYHRNNVHTNKSLGYQEHFEIEKVFDKKRGFDAIDSFMAEGNIRLMPEAGGIELRNRPTVEQSDPLKEYIDALIDNEDGITIDLRKPGTTENTLSNYVNYDSAFSSKQILSDINSYYNNGNIPRVINGVKYSLKSDFENLPSELKDGIIKKLKSENIKLEDLYEYEDGRRRVLEGVGRTRGSNLYINDTKRRVNIRSKSQILETVASEYELNGNKEAVEFVEDIIKKNRLYNEYEAKRLLNNADEYLNFKIIHNDALPIQFQEIKKENSEMNIDTVFYVADVNDKQYYHGGIYIPGDKGRILILLNDRNSYFVNSNRHEKTHHFQQVIPGLYNEFKNNINKIIDRKNLEYLYKIYDEKYKSDYRFFGEKYNEAIWEEVYAQIYALNELADNEKVYDVIEKFDEKIKEHYKMSHNIKYSLSKGQVAKDRANNSKMKVYSKIEAEKLINEIIAEKLNIGDKFGTLRGKNKAQTINQMFIALNSADAGYRSGIAQNIADYIIENAIYEDIYDDGGINEDVLHTYNTIKEYRGKLNLSSIKGEIYHKYDTRPGNAIIMQWGTSKDGQGVDTVAQELQERGIQIDAINEADIFFEMVDMYNNARDTLNQKPQKIKSDYFDSVELKTLRNELVRDILKGYDKYGEKSKFAGKIEKYKLKIENLSQRIKENLAGYRLTNTILDKVQGIKDWKLGTFVNASKYKSETFKNSLAELSKIKFRGNLNKSGTRKILSGVNDWYNKENPLLSYVDVINAGYYNEEIKYMLEQLTNNTGVVLSVQELKYLSDVLDYFKNLIERYNKIYKDGKFIDALPIAQKYVKQINDNKVIKVGWFSNVFSKILNNSKASYLQTFADPMTVARNFDKYENGFYTEMINRLREGSINASVMEMEIRAQLDEFLNKHINFGKDLKKRTIKYENYELPAQTAFLLYMTLNREQAQLGLANAGFSFEDINGNIHRVDGFNKEGFTSGWLVGQLSQSVREKLESQFTDVEKQYIKIAEKIFNEDCKEAKRKTDELRTGYSNVSEDYYVPIHRANISKTIDNNLYHEMDRVSNASFNKNIVKGAKGELFINSLDKVLDRHIRAVSQYANLSMVIEEFDILYNLDIMENANKPISVKTESANVWKDGYTYFKNLIGDIQGIPRGESNKIVSYLRSGFAKYQLGANPKVWATQFSSFFASSSILDYNSIVKGFAIDSKDVDEYCKLAKLRNYDNSAVLAQGVLDKVDKVGDFLMKPIGKTDRLVVKKLFGACQIQVEKNNGLKIGTEENKVKAGELLTSVILETQQNSLATERSNAMRSSSEFMKAITMFTSDAMKVVGRFMDSVGECSVLKAKIKQTTDTNEIERLKTKLKTAQKKVVKSSTALLSSAVFMALIAQAFKWLYNKGDEDENVVENIIVDAFGNMLGGLPLIKDLYSRLTEGYELNNYAYSAINDILDSFNSLINFEDKKPAQIIRSLVYSIGQVLGLPAKNIYNIFYGLSSRISPETGYKMNDLFYKQNYSSDLKKAIANDDDSMISTIVDLMLIEKIGEVNDEKTQKIMSELIKKGYSVLPKSASSTITYDGESIELTKRQKENFTKIYSQANDKLSSLTNGKSFEDLPDEVKAKSIKYIYDYYYEEALKDLLGFDSDEKKYLFAQAIDITKLAMIVAQVSQVVADTDKDGKTISGSRKAKIVSIINQSKLTATQKYMLMGYFGYKNTNGERQVKTYIQSLKLTKTEKETLFEMCGY